MGSEVLLVMRQPQSPAPYVYVNALLSFDHTRLPLASQLHSPTHPSPASTYAINPFRCIRRLKLAEVEHTVPTAYFTIIHITTPTPGPSVDTRGIVGLYHAGWLAGRRDTLTLTTQSDNDSSIPPGSDDSIAI